MSVQSTRLAERLAALASIDLSRLGSGGSITARDVAALLPPPSNVVAFAAPMRAKKSLPATRNERLALAKREMPHFYQTVDIALDRLLAFASEIGRDQSPALLDIVVLATARLLRRTETLNAVWQEDGLLLYDRVDIAVSSKGRHLIVPDADRKGLRGIAQAIAAAEEGIGTFAIADFTATGIRQASAIIDPHHAGAIALGAPQERAAMKDGAVGMETYCCLTLSADHRVIDGAAAAEFLSELKSLLKDPISLLL